MKDRVKLWQVEYVVQETRPHQAPIPLSRRPLPGVLEAEDLARGLNKILDDVTAAYGKDRDTLSVQWRRWPIRGDWKTFP